MKLLLHEMIIVIIRIRKHKKDCEEHIKLAADRAAKLPDEKLFKRPPEEEWTFVSCGYHHRIVGTENETHTIV